MNPVNCVTVEYVAGTNEIALIDMGVQGLSSGTNQLMLAPMFSQNGAAAQFAVGFYALQGAAPGGYASVHSMVSMALSPGVGYRFMAGARLLQVGTMMNDVVCRAVVTIAKRP